MNSVSVQLGLNSYDITIAPGALPPPLSPGRSGMLICDSNIWSLYAHKIMEKLHLSASMIIPAGESSKNLETLGEICRFAARNRLDRHSVIYTMGGGVVGDLGGFAAAVYQRGIDFIQLPTSLLAMVDSSIGGKTAVDIPEGKNLIGAFHQPLAVFSDIDVLATLPRGELLNGLAEVIKMAVALDGGFFDFLESRADKLGEYSGFAPLATEVVTRSCELKGAVVSADEHEHGSRALLNYGHTFGHAVELLSEFSIAHGAAVAIGMCVAGKLAAKLGRWNDANARRQERLLENIGLPTRIPPGMSPETIVEAMKSDKKNHDQRIVLILPDTIGHASIVDDVPEPAMLDALEYCR